MHWLRLRLLQKRIDLAIWARADPSRLFGLGYVFGLFFGVLAGLAIGGLR